MPWQPGYEVPQEPSWAYANWDQRLAPALMQAQQQLQGRGFDPSNAWWLTDTAFPQDSAAKLRGAYGNDLLGAARMFLSGQRPAGPGPATQVPGFYIDDPAGGTSNTGTAALGDPGSANVTGPNAAIGLTGLNVAMSPFGIVGAPNLAVQAAQAALSAANAGKSAGLVGNQTMNSVDPEGNPVNVAALRTGFFDSLLASLRGDPTLAFSQNPSLASFIAQNPNMTQDPETMNALTTQGMKFGQMAGPTIGQGLGFTEGGPHPAFGFQGFNMQSQNPSPYGQTPNVSPKASDVEAAPPAAPPEGIAIGDPSAGPPGDPAAGDATGAAAAGNPGAGPGTWYRGGPISKRKPPSDTHKGFARKKGSEVVPIKAHDGEFVVNKSATAAARPQLEALNALVPPPPRNKQDLTAMIENAKKYFDVVA